MIGIILCKEKSRTVVEYSLKETNKPINVASYRTTRSLPKKFRDELPSSDQIAKFHPPIQVLVDQHRLASVKRGLKKDFFLHSPLLKRAGLLDDA